MLWLDVSASQGPTEQCNADCWQMRKPGSQERAKSNSFPGFLDSLLHCPGATDNTASTLVGALRFLSVGRDGVGAVAGDLGKDLVGGFHPFERRRAFVVGVQKRTRASIYSSNFCDTPLGGWVSNLGEPRR